MLMPAGTEMLDPRHAQVAEKFSPFPPRGAIDAEVASVGSKVPLLAQPDPFRL